jgi:hypothetical protein
MKNDSFGVSVIVFAALAAGMAAVAQNQSRNLPDDRPRKGDGFIHLKGTIQEANTNAETVTFQFSGHLHFSFFTAAYGDSTRKRMDMDFDVKKVPVSVSRFGKAEYDVKSDPFIVSFRNATQHALEVSQSGEPASIALFRPRISYESNGTIGEISCGSAQVLPDRLVKELHGNQKP